MKEICSPKIDAAVVPAFLAGTRVHARVLRARNAHAVGDPHAMANVSKTLATDGVPTYLGRGDPAGTFADYYPAWMDKLAGDVTLRVPDHSQHVDFAEQMPAVTWFPGCRDT